MSTILITVDSKEHDRLVASTVRAMRQNLGVKIARLAKASGISRRGIEAIEGGGATTLADRHDITFALAWLSNDDAAKGRNT